MAIQDILREVSKWRSLVWGNYDPNLGALDDVPHSDGAGGIIWKPAGGGGGAGGKVVNVRAARFSDVLTGAGPVMVFDDTPPLNTEGNEVMTLAYTPADSNNRLRIDVVANWAYSNGSAGLGAGALFRDNDSEALAAAYSPRVAAANQITCTKFTYWMDAGTTNEIEFKVRVGANAAGTVTLNGQAGARDFGGRMASTITVTEYEPETAEGEDMWELIETNTISGSPSQIDLTWDESVYSEIMVVLDGIQPASSGVTLRARLGDANGGTIHATTGDYDGVQQVWEGSGTISALAGSDRVDLAQSASSAAGETISGMIRVIGGRSSNTGAALRSIIHYINNSSNQRTIETKAFLDDNVQAAIDTIRLFFASGNFANVGTVKLYGLRLS